MTEKQILLALAFIRDTPEGRPYTPWRVLPTVGVDLDELLDEGLVTVRGTRLALTPAGKILADQL